MLAKLSGGSPRQLVRLPGLIVLPLIALLILGVPLTLLPELERSANADLQRRTAVLAERISAQLRNQVIQLQQLARSPALRDAQHQPALARAELNWLLEHQPAFVWLGLVARDGKVLAGSRGWLEGESVGERPIFNQALQDGKIRGDFRPETSLQPLMPVHADADDEVFDIAVRLVDASGQPFAVLTAQVGSRWLGALEQHALEGLPAAGSPTVHFLIGTPPREIHAEPASPPGSVASLSPAWLAWATAHDAAAPPSDTLASRHDVNTQALGPVTALPWRVMLRRDRVEALQSVGQLTEVLALWGALVAALVGGSGVWAARRMTRPWQALIDAAARDPEAGNAPLGRYADVVHHALSAASPTGGRPGHALDATDAVLARLAADVLHIKRVLDHLPVGVVLSGRNFEVEYANTTLTQQLGLSNAAVAGRLDGEFLCYPADATPLAAQLRAMESEPRELAARFVARQADGSPRAVQWHFVPLFDSQGVFEGAISVITDIDAETSARQRAASLDQRLQLLLQVAIDHALVLLDEEGHILSWNVGATQVFGDSAAHASAREFDTLFESQARAVELPKRLLAQARQDGRVSIDGPQLHATGRPLYVSGSLYAMPPRAWPAAYALIVRDTTAQREDAQRLAESEARLAAVVGGASDAIVSIDPSGQVELFNPAAERIFGRDAASVLGRPIDELLESGAWHHSTKAVNVSMGPRRVKGLRADGTDLDLEASVAQAQVGGRAVLIAILRDVTSRLQSERALAHYRADLADLSQRLLIQEKETTRHLAQILHDDLGQTLAAMRLTFDACRSAFPAEGKIADRLARLDGLIATGHQRVRRAMIELRPPLLDDEGLAAALHNKVEVLRGAHPEVHIHFSLTPGSADRRWTPSVEYTAFMIAREALRNALQHGQPASIEVRLECGPSSLRLEVLDDGTGLPADAARKPGHLGLVGMRERALAIGALLSVAARHERGTSVLLKWTEPGTHGKTR